jgi:hypothetical protein
LCRGLGDTWRALRLVVLRNKRQGKRQGKGKAIIIDDCRRRNWLVAAKRS